MEPLRILCAGDLHLGRYPSKIAPGQPELAVDAVWRRCVEIACERRVDVLVLTGDIVDADNKMYEAMPALEAGIKTLAAADIPVVAVAGNHDYDAFPRLIANLGEGAPVHLLGAGGRWESLRIERRGRPTVRLVGWSFPERYVPRSPLESFQIEQDEAPVLGVLHCDIDQPRSRYAPVTRQALARAPVAGWLLGHIHQHDAHYEGEQLQLYSGSLQPLHANEPGHHGAWLIEVDPGGATRADLLPIATLHYDRVSVDVTDLETVEDIERAAGQAVRDALAVASGHLPALERAVYRIAFEGRTSLAPAIDAWAPAFVDGFEPIYDGVPATVESYRIATGPTHDLHRLARSNDAPGILAQLLLDLRGDVEEPLARRALALCQERVGGVYEQSAYESLRREPHVAEKPSDEDIRAMLQRRGLMLLDVMLQEVHQDA